VKKSEIKKIEFEDGELYLGDCMEVMRRLPQDSVDLILGSPPY
jgi:DNA modification methylase